MESFYKRFTLIIISMTIIMTIQYYTGTLNSNLVNYAKGIIAGMIVSSD